MPFFMNNRMNSFYTNNSLFLVGDGALDIPKPSRRAGGDSSLVQRFLERSDYLFGLLEKTNDASSPKQIDAVMPPAVAPIPPVSAPSNPFSSTAVLTPFAIA